MKINQIDVHRLRMPLKSPFETSFGRLTYKDFLVVSVHSEDLIGYGESASLPFPIYNEETTGTVSYMLKEFLIPKLFSIDQIDHPEEVSKAFEPIRRNNMAKATLEGAVWDLYSKRKGISLAKALGGYKREIEVGVSIGIEPTVEEVLEKVERFIYEGYKKIKVKIKPGFDIEPIRAIRERFGQTVNLMADANSAYTLDHMHVLKELDQYNLLMIEQPLAHDDIIDHSLVQEQLNTPICLDESIHSVEDARKAIELGSCKIINIKTGRVGGLMEAKRIHDFCKSKNIPVWCGGMLEAGIGRAHNIALTSLDNFMIPGDTSASDRYWDLDIVVPAVILSSPGKLEVPDYPGIGYEINEEAFNRYVVERETFTNEKVVF
ncbi:o-succinylbenzoate synthase [Fictibacillus barbaricus]|uniref:o-succinylbenzoate synthase n=1 Tax=Fictibacillus barbaricus TaxID=182136 RepID=A0ABS2Z8P6_9BACL|nr:o-succinylbenzoate synthase [Fictibacillus barbaricus]MBN3544200.1 o-succinylbenzoate synthase [Fictibacillus barbaricus]GGB69741.1 o-succinylbenzoate synthase [Fictibacillus barbaricus]